MASEEKQGDKLCPYKSKQQIKCGYCKVSMCRDRLGEHTESKHPGLPKKELQEGQVTLLDLFSKRKTQEIYDSDTKRTKGD